jgi:uncharacterized protein with HEPN domain
MNPRDRAYLQHIQDAIHEIENFSRNLTSASDLKDRSLERAGIERMLTIIGEAAKNISSEFKESHPGIPWKKATGMRDKLIHHYFGVDYEAVWETLERDIPELNNKIKEILQEQDFS